MSNNKNKILIVEGCVGDGSAGKADRFNNSFGCQNTGAANLHHDILHYTGLFLRGMDDRLCGGGPDSGGNH